jgi:voltage-gated potassium channel Kch
MPALLLVLIRFIRSIWRGLEEPEFRGIFSWVVILLLTGTLFYHQWEGWSWLDSLYFSVVTLTTVGYGDLSPQTAVGKIFTIIYIILGLGILSSFIVLLAEHQSKTGGGIIQRLASRTKNRDSEQEVEN